MPAPNEPPRRPGTPPPAKPSGPPSAAPAPTSPQRLGKARPESTVTLMVQSGQAPGGLSPAKAPDAPPAKPPSFFARAWAAIKGWF